MHTTRTKILVPLLFAAAAILLHYNGLNTGFFLDDHTNRIMLQTTTPQQQSLSPYMQIERLAGLDAHKFTHVLMNQFCFFPNIKQEKTLLQNAGLLGWWIDPNHHICFWRPLTSATHALDYKFWPDRPLLMHLHSAFWLSLFIGMSLVFYRRFLGANVTAYLASLCMLFSPFLTLSVGWISFRNNLLATLFALLTVYLHDLWRKQKSTTQMILTMCCFGLALLSSETSANIMSILVAYALVMERVRLKTKLVSLLPYICVFGIWFSIYNLLGYGVGFNDLYINFLQAPYHYLTNIDDRFPALFISQWLMIPAEQLYDGSQVSSQFRTITNISFALLVLLLTWLFYPVIKKYPVNKWLTLSMLFSYVIICQSFPNARLLFIPYLASYALIASATTYHWKNFSLHKITSSIRLFFCGLFLFTNIIFAGFLTVYFETVLFNNFSKEIQVTAIPHEASFADKTIYFLNHPDPLAHSYTVVKKIHRTEPVYQFMMVSPGFTKLSVTTLDEHSLEIESLDGALFQTYINTDANVTLNFSSVLILISWQGDFPFDKHSKIPIEDGQIKIIDVDHEGTPTKITITLDEPLTHESNIWVIWDHEENRFNKIVLPDINQSIIIKGP